MEIEPFDGTRKQDVLDLSMRAWEPVFAAMRPAVPAFVFDAFYPCGWAERQLADVGLVLESGSDQVSVAVEDGRTIGWIAVRLHPEDLMGEIYVLAVDPEYQRRGVGTALLDHAFARIREAGLRMVMVETGDDPGHAPSRASYEAAGFERWPVARYFKDLTADEDRA